MILWLGVLVDFFRGPEVPSTQLGQLTTTYNSNCGESDASSGHCTPYTNLHIDTGICT